jgi:DNA-binding GntR family transcriptional regulator
MPVSTATTARHFLEELTVLVPDGQRTDSQSSVAYFLIRDLIVTLELAPGTPISERDLMQRIALGRTPVREALRRLADEGLVAIYARRGMAVAPVDVRDLAGISEVRVEMEGFAARLAAARATPHDRETGAALVSALDHLSAQSDPRALIRLDQRVHHYVHRCTHNAYLQTTLTGYLTLSLRLWFLGLDQVARLDQAVREHRDLLQAILAGDGDRAEAVARGHVAGFQQEIRRVLTHG